MEFSDLGDFKQDEEYFKNKLFVGKSPKEVHKNMKLSQMKSGRNETEDSLDLSDEDFNKV
jgi:hypothetical protein